MAELTVGELARLFWNSGLPIFMFGLWTYAGYKGWWVWGRERDAALALALKNEVAANEYKSMTFRLLGHGERSQELLAEAVKK